MSSTLYSPSSSDSVAKLDLFLASAAATVGGGLLIIVISYFGLVFFVVLKNYHDLASKMKSTVAVHIPAEVISTLPPPVEVE